MYLLKWNLVSVCDNINKFYIGRIMEDDVLQIHWLLFHKYVFCQLSRDFWNKLDSSLKKNFFKLSNLIWVPHVRACAKLIYFKLCYAFLIINKIARLHKKCTKVLKDKSVCKGRSAYIQFSNDKKKKANKTISP